MTGFGPVIFQNQIIMSDVKMVEVTILKDSFGMYNNCTPVGKKTKVPADVAEKMKKTEHAK